MNNLQGKTVAILATHGFEESELFEPRQALTSAGAKAEVVSPESGKIQGFKHFDKGQEAHVDCDLRTADPSRYDALVIPGGLFNPDSLRTDESALRFAQHFAAAGKPIAAICHGPWVLINADLVKARKMTAVPSIHRDLENAGAKVVDEEVVVDGSFITSRTPKDLPAFCQTLVNQIASAGPG